MRPVKIVDRDNGWRAIMIAFRMIEPTAVRIGVSDTPREVAPNRKSLSNETLGAFHEFGLGSNPQRSFLRAWLDDEDLWLPKLKEYVLKSPSESHSDAAWIRKFAEFCVNSVRERMRKGIPPQLQEATIERKGGNTIPLIDTEQLINAIIYEIKSLRK